MKRNSVNSSHIRSIGFDNGNLEVEFQNGHVYSYENVPQQHFHSLMNHKSCGSCFNKLIKGKFNYKKLSS